MNNLELDAVIKTLVFRIKVVTGWAIPELESERAILYTEINKHFLEKWSTFNSDEIMYAMRNYAGENWGKDINLQLIDAALDMYHETRMEVSKIEECKKQVVVEKEFELTDWKEVCELYYQNFLLKGVNVDVLPPQLYNELVNSGYAAPGLFADFLRSGYSDNQKRIDEAKRQATKFVFAKARDAKMKNLFIKEPI